MVKEGHSSGYFLMNSQHIPGGQFAATNYQGMIVLGHAANRSSIRIRAGVRLQGLIRQLQWYSVTSVFLINFSLALTATKSFYKSCNDSGFFTLPPSQHSGHPRLNNLLKNHAVSKTNCS
jgi:hypothetical protein